MPHPLMGVMLILLGASLALQTWSAGAKARARKITLVQTALALPAQQELTSLKEEVGANLARVRAGNGWCFNDEELLTDLQCQGRSASSASSTTSSRASRRTSSSRSRSPTRCGARELGLGLG